MLPKVRGRRGSEGWFVYFQRMTKKGGVQVGCARTMHGKGPLVLVLDLCHSLNVFAHGIHLHAIKRHVR